MCRTDPNFAGQDPRSSTYFEYCYGCHDINLRCSQWHKVVTMTTFSFQWQSYIYSTCRLATFHMLRLIHKLLVHWTHLHHYWWCVSTSWWQHAMTWQHSSLGHYLYTNLEWPWGCCWSTDASGDLLVDMYSSCILIHEADSRFAPSQWETALLCNDVSHWLGASLESALIQDCSTW